MRLHHSVTSIAAIIVAGAMVVGCKARRTTSATRDLNAGQGMSQTSIEDDPKIKARIPVLIYYANDTHYSVHEDKSYDNMIKLVQAIDSAQTDKNISAEDKAYLSLVSKRLTDDWTSFMRAVDAESMELQSYACRKNARYKMGLAIFRNSSMASIRYDEYQTDRDVNWYYCKPDGRDGIEGPTAKIWNIRWFDDFRYDSQPLSHPRVFEGALKQVREVFPAEKYKYILVTKSHGSSEMSITPNLVIDASGLQAADINKTLLAHKTARNSAGAELEDFKTLMPTLASFNGVNAALATIAQTNDGRFSAEQIGVNKRRYLEVLNQEGGGDPTSGMYFPLVFMESCNSQLQSSSDDWIQETINVGRNKVSYAGLNLRNIGKMFTSDAKGLAYRTLRYGEMFTNLEYNKFLEFQEAISYQLESVLKRQAANNAKPPIANSSGQ